MPETAYLSPPPCGGRLEHAYGANVHVLSDAWALSLLARLGHPETHNPLVLDLVTAAYRRLISVAVEQLPLQVSQVPTRMGDAIPGTAYHGALIDPESAAVVVDVARAGILPSMVLQRALLELLSPKSVRVDHIYMQRVAHPESGKVTGIDMSGSKIGGPVDGVTMFVPDPMAATGSSMRQVLDHFAQQVPGRPRRIVLCHLMATPEYLRAMTTAHPEVVIYALRVDRGLSPDHVLQAMPGAYWDQERGLSDTDYIVPGAGGLGELINNAFV